VEAAALRDYLIDWNVIPDDSIFKLTFPQPGMVHPDEFEPLRALATLAADRSSTRHSSNACFSEGLS